MCRGQWRWDGPQRRRELGPANRWKIVVLEDAGEFLAPDAKHLKGQALSRLLNVCDGVLGSHRVQARRGVDRGGR